MRRSLLAVLLLACQKTPTPPTPAPESPRASASLAAASTPAAEKPGSEDRALLLKVDRERRAIFRQPATPDEDPNGVVPLLARLDRESKPLPEDYQPSPHMDRDSAIFNYYSVLNPIVPDDIRAYCRKAKIVGSADLVDEALMGRPVRISGRLAQKDILQGNGLRVDLGEVTVALGGLMLEHGWKKGSRIDVLGLLARPRVIDGVTHPVLAGWAVIAPGSCERVAKLYAPR